MTTATQNYKIIEARFPGTCKRCQGPIKAGQLIQYFYEDRRISHALPAECLRPIETDQVEAPAPVPTTKPIADGYYTVATRGKDHKTFRIQTQPRDADFAPGKQVISYLTGPCNEADYLKFGFVADGQVKPWKRFCTGYTAILEAARFLVGGDHQAAGKLYAMQCGTCYKCGRLLTTPESVKAGLGPTCAGRI